MLEIAVQDVSGAVAAVRAGAQRLELCTALAATGGVTPGIGLLERVLEAVPDVGVHVLVRPRPGGFVYAPDEVDVLVREVRAVVRSGAAGVVVGALTDDGRVDERVLGRLADEAQGVELTFHRAFDALTPVARQDVTPVPADDARPPASRRRGAAVDGPMLAAALDVLAAHGVTRVLTSGGATRVGRGLPRIRTTVELAAGRVQVMAGGGVQVAEIGTIVATGVDAVHLSASRTVSGDGGPGAGSDASWTTTDPYLVAAARAALT
ncbi:copper homeostasis protein CutC [Cellulomonas persica]|uniref:copper homeostasis protein CutC n=1 Tax=Cellulomonas persica TaxID=76861 RepID=UPI0011BE1F5B|nr:copper homeostasis protein CutC [Cellulomonas persica]